MIRLADKFSTTSQAPLVGLVESDLEPVGDIKGADPFQAGTQWLEQQGYQGLEIPLHVCSR